MEWVGDKMMKEMIKGGKEKILERNLYIHNTSVEVAWGTELSQSVSYTLPTKPWEKWNPVSVDNVG